MAKGKKITKMQRRADKVAEEHTRKTGTPVHARVIQSKGQATTAYDVQLTSGETYTLHNVNHPLFTKDRA